MAVASTALSVGALRMEAAPLRMEVVTSAARRSTSCSCLSLFPPRRPVASRSLIAVVRDFRLAWTFWIAFSKGSRSFGACWVGAARVVIVRQARPRRDVKRIVVVVVLLLMEELEGCFISCRELFSLMIEAKGLWLGRSVKRKVFELD